MTLQQRDIFVQMSNCMAQRLRLAMDFIECLENWWSALTAWTDGRLLPYSSARPYQASKLAAFLAQDSTLCAYAQSPYTLFDPQPIPYFTSSSDPTRPRN